MSDIGNVVQSLLKLDSDLRIEVYDKIDDRLYKE